MELQKALAMFVCYCRRSLELEKGHRVGPELSHGGG